MDNRRNENSVSEVENIDEEKLRTLWCGSINERVNENILFELFLNAGPLERVSIPKDRDSGRQKGYAFIVFQHVESIKYAFELLNGTELFRQPIRLQQKETGLGRNNWQIFCLMFTTSFSRTGTAERQGSASGDQCEDWRRISQQVSL